MKKFVIVFLAILIIALLLVTGNLYYKMNEKDISSVDQSEKLKQLENRIAELENKIAEQDEVEIDKDEEDKAVSNADIEFDADKMKVKSSKMTYEAMEVLNDAHGGIEVEIRNGKAYLTTDINDETFKTQYFPNVKDAVENQEITGFSTKIKELHYGYFGNGIEVPVLFFLMEDGTVEYVNTEKMIKNEDYKSLGKMKQLSDIIKFEEVAVGDVDENGEAKESYRSVVAIDKDGYAYDLNELI